MPVGAAIGGAAIIGGVATNNAANRTARAAENTANTNNALQRDIYNRNVAIQTPYLQSGNRSMQAWMSMMGLAPETQPAATPSVSSMGNYQTNPAVSGGDPGTRGLPGLTRQLELSSDLNGSGMPMANTLPTATGTGAVGSGIKGEDFTGPQINPGAGGGVNAMDGVVGSTGTGTNALTGYDAFRQSLGYQSGLDEGNRALTARQASQGRLLSGDAAREAARYNTDYAQRWAGNYLDRLMQGTMLGSGAANALAGVGTNYASAVGNNNQNALAVQSNAWNQGAQGISDAAGNIAGGIAYGAGNNWGRTGSMASSYSGGGRPIWF